MNEIMETTDMEHLNADREIAYMMLRREEEQKQKIDDYIKAEAAKYNMHMKKVRKAYHRFAHAMLVCVGAGLSFAVMTFVQSNILLFACAVVSTAISVVAYTAFDKASRRR